MIKRLLFNGVPAKEYQGICIADSDIREQVFLKCGEEATNISRRHSIICLEPYSIAIWMSKPEYEQLAIGESYLEIKSDSIIVAKVQLSQLGETTAGDTIVVLFNVKKARCFQIGWLRQYLLFRYFRRNKNNTFWKTRVNGALFSYPRKVVLVTVKNGEKFHVFPMDFRGYIEESGYYILGLRTTNVALGKMLESKKLVVAETGLIQVETVYTLGKYHSQAPPALSELPFKTQPSKLYLYPVYTNTPEYYELEVKSHMVIGSHALIVCKIVNHEIANAHVPVLSHIHVFEYLAGNYTAIADQ